MVLCMVTLALSIPAPRTWAKASEAPIGSFPIRMVTWCIAPCEMRVHTTRALWFGHANNSRARLSVGSQLKTGDASALANQPTPARNRSPAPLARYSETLSQEDLP